MMARGHIYRQHNSATIIRDQRQHLEQRQYHEARKSDALLNELKDRLGIERYTEFVSQYGGAADFREKAAAMLDTLDWRDQHHDERP